MLPCSSVFSPSASKRVFQRLLAAFFHFILIFLFLFSAPGSPPTAAATSSCRCYLVTASRAAPLDAGGFCCCSQVEEEERKKNGKNSSKTGERADVWSLCRPACLFVCFIFVLFFLNLCAKLTCSPVAVQLRPLLLGLQSRNVFFTRCVCLFSLQFQKIGGQFLGTVTEPGLLIVLPYF